MALKCIRIILKDWADCAGFEIEAVSRQQDHAGVRCAPAGKTFLLKYRPEVCGQFFGYRGSPSPAAANSLWQSFQESRNLEVWGKKL